MQERRYVFYNIFRIYAHTVYARAMAKLKRRQWDPPKGGKPPPSPEPSEMLPRIFFASDGPEVREAHEQAMADRRAAIEAHRERHRKRRGKSSGWTLEVRAAALEAYRQQRAAVEHEPAVVVKVLSGASLVQLEPDAKEVTARPEEEFDAALAILALGVLNPGNADSISGHGGQLSSHR